MSDVSQLGLDAGREALRRFLVGDDDLATMLTKITMIAADAIPGADSVSITTVSRGRLTTPASTDKRSLALDTVQYDLDDGPCIAALRHQGVEHIITARDTRWPTFSRAARQEGVAEVLSAPMMEGEVARGALNLYSGTTFGEDASDLACRFADQLGIAALNATLYVEGTLMAEQLTQAMESPAVIEQAKGILMGAEGCDAEAAFGILRTASQNQNRKLREIAQEIVDRHVAAGRRDDGQ